MLEESFKKIRSEWFDKFIKIKRPIFCQPDMELDELLNRDNLKNRQIFDQHTEDIINGVNRPITPKSRFELK